MAIKPINLPSAAGINYGEGDVRHYSEGDAVDVPGLANPTRMLAERDNVVTDKLNEVIEVVNNQEQFVPLPVMRTTLPGNDEAIVANYRIPEGFECRVLNATISSSPISSSIELNIYYTTGFGGSTGESIITTATEFTAGTQFKQKGEFVIAIKNKSSVSLDIVASILLTMRPIGAKGSLLVGSVVKGEKGDPGGKGDKGEPGPPGTGGAGSPGMVWQSAWAAGRNYQNKDVVSFPLFGTVTSSYFCKQNHLSSTSNQPPNTTFWDAVAVGSTGSVTTVTQTFTSGSIPTYAVTTVFGTLTTGADWLGENVDGYQAGNLAASTTYTNFSCNQFSIESVDSPVSPKGMAFLMQTFRRSFRGSGTFTLPKQAYGAKTDFNNSSIQMVATANGTADLFGGNSVPLVTCIPVSTDQYVIKSTSADPIRIAISMFGAQAY